MLYELHTRIFLYVLEYFEQNFLVLCIYNVEKWRHEWWQCFLHFRIRNFTPPAILLTSTNTAFVVAILIHVKTEIRQKY